MSQNNSKLLVIFVKRNCETIYFALKKGIIKFLFGVQEFIILSHVDVHTKGKRPSLKTKVI